jgi:lipoprotein-anchoring transpeptidase ErfK/SrfK
MRLEVCIADQTADLFDDAGVRIRRYVVSTALKGPGEVKDSYQTPRGRHVVRAKIGGGATPGTVFSRRRPTGEVCTPKSYAETPGRDWILTRILWLSGMEPGVNRLGDRDTMQRYIYIHGTPDETRLGVPGSRGCIRMSNRDIVELFDLLPCYSGVDILEDKE